MGKAEWGADPEFFGPRHAHREGRITTRLKRHVPVPGLHLECAAGVGSLVSLPCPRGAHRHLGRPFDALAPGARHTCRISRGRRTGSAGSGRHHRPPVRRRDVFERLQRRDSGAHPRPRRGRRRTRPRTRLWRLVGRHGSGRTATVVGLGRLGRTSETVLGGRDERDPRRAPVWSPRSTCGGGLSSDSTTISFSNGSIVAVSAMTVRSTTIRP